MVQFYNFIRSNDIQPYSTVLLFCIHIFTKILRRQTVVGGLLVARKVRTLCVGGVVVVDLDTLDPQRFFFL